MGVFPAALADWTQVKSGQEEEEPDPQDQAMIGQSLRQYPGIDKNLYLEDDDCEQGPGSSLSRARGCTGGS